jgi:excisionase family DNA binding protein
MSKEEYLELAEAAAILSVHPSTLRRWADEGKVPHLRTLSGRRRFTRSNLEQIQRGNRPADPIKADQLESKTLSLTRARTSMISHHESGWFSRLNDEQRMLFRYSGQRLLGLMMQFISRSDSADTFLEEGKKVAGDYGLICYKAGLSVSQTAEAFLYFRRSIIESVQATSGLSGPHDEDGQRIFLRTIDFFDALLVATIESYAKLSETG